MGGTATIDLNWGPSDTDRPNWLAARRLGVTATNMAAIHGGSSAPVSALIREKREGESFHGNRYTEWGKHREPIIAEAIERAYAISHESRLARAADNPRFLASPDGLALDLAGDLIASEIKTSGKDLSIGGKAFAHSGYDVQMTWVMRVTGARRCLFAWEERIEVDGEFQPGALHFEWFDYDEALAAELEAEATAFLAALDAASAEPFEEQDVDELLDTLALNVITGRVQESQGKQLKESAWLDLLALLGRRGKDFHQKSLLAQITYTAEHDEHGTEVDVESARDAAPALAAEVDAARAHLAELQAAWDEHAKGYTRPTVSKKKAALTVTAVKQKGSKE